MELFLFYVIGLTLVSFISIILTENPLAIPQLPHARTDLELNIIHLPHQSQELNQRMDLIGATRLAYSNNQSVSGEASLAELTACPARAKQQKETVL